MILLDTQSVIWLNKDQVRLSEAALQAMTDARSRGASLAIADITFWKFAMWATRDRLGLAKPLTAVLEEIAKLYTVLSITPLIAATSMKFSDAFPRDPADRLIAATALVHNIPLVTADKKIRTSGEVPTIW